MIRSRLRRTLTSWWFWGVILLLGWGLLVWFAAPLIAVGEARPLAGAAARLTLILPAVAAWGVVNLWLRLRQAQANARLVEDLTQAEREQAAREDAERSAVGEELAAIRHRSAEALRLLRKPAFGRGFGRRYLYQLPWYAVIGPPASGKTTALMNAGLNFPLEQRLGPRGMAGLGGTRNTDWWLADEALLIDTAGRYTTQDTCPGVDGAVWSGFLAMVKRHRPRQPLNGVMVVVSPSELARMEDDERRDHADAIRLRLLELKTALGVRLPIYVLFSKADLVLGFAEFFDALGREERGQVWGATFPFDDGRDPDGLTGQFAPAFDALLARLRQRVMRRLHEEPDSRRRTLILDFPAQLAALKPVMGEFLDQVFRPNRYEGQFLLRGFYLSSSTQRGLPEDLLADAIAPAFGLDGASLRAVPEPPPRASRSCFLPGLFREVIFAEANLVGLDRRLERGRQWAGWAAAVGMVLASALGAGVCVAGFDTNRSVLEATLDRAGRLQKGSEDGNREQADLGALAVLLDGLRDLRPDSAAIPATGLLPVHEMDGAAVAAYERGLRHLLLPRILGLAEARLRDPRTARPLAYETLKVYLMLGGEGPLDIAVPVAWLGHELQARRPDASATRDSLVAHMRALSALLPVTGTLSPILVADTRSRLSDMTLAARGYDMIRDLAATRALPPWRPSDHAGAAAAKIFVRPSGRSLWDGIDGFHTRSGFFDVFLPAATKVADELAKESWVLGASDRPLGAETLRADMLSLYLDDYVRAWDDMLVDVVAVPFHSSSHAADNLNILAGPSSPLKKFLSAVAGETDLDTPPQSLLAAAEAAAKLPPVPPSLAERAISQAAGAVSPQAQLAMAAQFLGTGRRATPPGHPVTAHFKGTHDMVNGVDGNPPALDTVLKGMGDMYKVFAKLAATPSNAAAVMANSDDMRTATGKVILQADKLPQPVDSMVGAVAESATSVAIGGARDYMDIVWHNLILPKCQGVVIGRYPFDRSSTLDAPLADFAALLGAGGQIEQFFNTHLRPFVDMTVTPWRWQSVDGVSLELPDEVLAQFERAASVRQAMFPGDSKFPRIDFQLEPVKVSESIDRVQLSLNGQNLAYSHGPVAAIAMQWPGPKDGPAAARLSFSPERGEERTLMSAKGPYATLRLLEAGKLAAGDQPDRFRLDYALGQRRVSLELTADSLSNPFTVLPELERFRCPDWRDKP